MCRLRLGTFTYTGGWIGNVIALLSCGLIAGSPLGWPGCFYIWGTLTVAWSVAWFFLGKESPADHPSIPIDEKEYIEVSLGVTETSEVRTAFFFLSILNSYKLSVVKTEQLIAEPNSGSIDSEFVSALITSRNVWLGSVHGQTNVSHYDLSFLIVNSSIVINLQLCSRCIIHEFS